MENPYIKLIIINPYLKFGKTDHCITGKMQLFDLLEQIIRIVAHLLENTKTSILKCKDFI